MVPRTRVGDDYLRQHYSRGARQLVLLGAGFDARAYRMEQLNELDVFEVDQQTTFDVKEPLLKGEPLLVRSRAVVATEFTERGRWGRDLEQAGFNASVPTVWLLEGLLMYLTLDDTAVLMQEIGRLSAPGSAVFHDACSAGYVAGGRGPVVGGAKFLGGSDDYGLLWRSHAGFTHTCAPLQARYHRLSLPTTTAPAGMPVHQVRARLSINQRRPQGAHRRDRPAHARGNRARLPRQEPRALRHRREMTKNSCCVVAWRERER